MHINSAEKYSSKRCGSSQCVSAPQWSTGYRFCIHSNNC